MWQWQCGEGNAARAVDRAARAAAARAGRLLLGRRRCQIAAAFTATMAAKGCAAVCRGRLGSNLYVRPVMKPATNERTRMYERCRGRPKAPPGPQRARETPPSAGQSHADDYYASGASMAAVCSSAAEITPVCCSSTCCASLPKVPRCLQCGRVIFAVAPPDHLPSVPTGSSRKCPILEQWCTRVHKVQLLLNTPDFSAVLLVHRRLRGMRRGQRASHLCLVKALIGPGAEIRRALAETIHPAAAASKATCRGHSAGKSRAVQAV